MSTLSKEVNYGEKLKEVTDHDIEDRNITLNSVAKYVDESGSEVYPSNKKVDVEPKEAKLATRGYKVTPSEKPATSAMPRPENEGESIPTGTDFRAVIGSEPDNINIKAHSAINEAGAPIDIAELKEKTFWIDFGDKTPGVVTNLGPKSFPSDRDTLGTLRVGTTYTKAITENYIVKAEIIELKPFAINETNMYRPDPRSDVKVEKNTPANIGIRPADKQYSHLLKAGLLDKNSTVIGSEKPGGNIGFKVKITATYKGLPIAPTVLAADAEEAGEGEAVIFKTNGTPWSIYANVRRGNNKGRVSSTAIKDTNITQDNLNSLAKKPYAYINSDGELSGNYVPIGADALRKTDNGFEHAYKAADPDSPLKDSYSREGMIRDGWINSDLNTGGLGSQTFGPVMTSMNKYSVPIIESTAKTTEDGVTLEVYINSQGAQHAVFGVAFYDRGDAPNSYGIARHLINETNNINNPFLGEKDGDADVVAITEEWIGDDNHEFKDEGNEQLTGSEFTKIIKASDSTYVLENVSVNPNGNASAYVRGFVDFNNNGVFDKSEASDTIQVNSAGKITLTFRNPPQITDTALEKVGVRVRVSKDEKEVSVPFGIATSGEVEDFTTQVIHPPRGERKTTEGEQGQPQNTKVNFTAHGKLKNSDEVNSMDSDIAVKIVSPTGELVDTWTEEGQGTYTVTATGDITFQPDPNFKGIAKGIVLRATDKNGLDSGWTSAKDEESTNDDGTKFINQLDNINDGSHTISNKTMDAVYIPTVVTRTTPNSLANNSTTKDVQGAVQKSPIVIGDDSDSQDDKKTVNFKPGDQTVTIDMETVKLLDKQGEPVETGVTVPALDSTGTEIGTYKIENNEVVFTPIPEYTGLKKGDNGSAVENPVTPARIRATDSNGRNVVAEYLPIVEPVRPTSTDSETTGLQGQPQESPIVIGEDSGNIEDNKTLNLKEGDPKIPINTSTIILLNGDDEPVESVEVFLDGKKRGTYSLNKEKTKVIFTPEKDFVGTPAPATIQAKDKNGTSTIAYYQPTVTPVEPMANPSETTGLQGQTQESPILFVKDDAKNTLNFTEGDQVAPIKQDSIKLVQKTPESPEEAPVYTEVPSIDVYDKAEGEVGRKKIGTYTLSKDKINVIFTPEKDFTGETEDGQKVSVPSAIIQAADANGTTVVTTYTPKVIPVIPTGESVTSIDIQGATQTGTPTFKGGTVTVNEEEKTVPVIISSKNPAKLIHPELNVPTDENVVPAFDEENNVVGTYKINPNTGEVTFIPEKNYTGAVALKGVMVQAKDENGTPVTAMYTPKVIPVIPTATPAETEGPQGQTQTAPILFKTDVDKDNKGTVNFLTGDKAEQPVVTIKQDSVRLLDKDGHPQTEISATLTDGVTQVGIYRLEDGVVKFIPNPDYTGLTEDGQPNPVLPANLVAEDTNGTTASTIYQPKVTSVTPEPGKPEEPTVPNTPEPGKPEEPTVPNTPEPGKPDVPTVPNTPEPGKPDVPTVPNTPEPGKPEEPTVPSIPEPGKPEKPEEPSTPLPPTFDEEKPNNPEIPVQSLSETTLDLGKIAQEKREIKLPNTGVSGMNSTIAGFAMLTLAGFLSRRKKKD